MIFIKVVAFLSLLHVAYMNDNEKAPLWDTTACEQAQQATTYWTEWYSTSNSLGPSETANFTHLCSDIRETQCREKYTHSSLGFDSRYVDTCDGGVLRCWSFKSCVNLEVRLRCSYTNDTLPEPDLHWSLSELDSDHTQGAIESWNCKDKVMQVDPINGTIVGEVVQGEWLSQTKGPQSHHNLCGVRTNGNASLTFRPFVQNCLTSPDCCNADHGISVMFWLRKDETDENRSRPQSSPLHVFRSPSLDATVQSGHLIVTYQNVNTKWTVNTTVADREWTHVTITFDLLTNLTVYLNSQAEGEAMQSTTSPLKDKLHKFISSNTTFQVFSNEGDVTSSDIRPIALTDLKVFYTALSANVVHRMFHNEREGATPRVMRMATSQKDFRDSETQQELYHIKLTCLIRTHEGTDLDVRFMYQNTEENFEEITSSNFLVTSYFQEENAYRMTAVAQIFGRRNLHSTESLPSRFTCEVVSDSQLSVYGYPTVQIYGSTNLDDTDSYYWTKFFDTGPVDDQGDEVEIKDDHLVLSKGEEFNPLCQHPTYADCKTASGSPWYEVNPSFVPDFNYTCNGNGIRCSSDEGHNQECPDLQVRYACRVSDTTILNRTTLNGNDSSTTSMAGNGTHIHHESEKTNSSSITTSDSMDKHAPVTHAPDSTQSNRSDTDTPPTTTEKVSSRIDITKGPGEIDALPSESTSASPSPETSTTPSGVSTTHGGIDSTDSKHAQDISTSNGSTDVSTAPDVMSSTTAEQAQDISTSTAPADVSTTSDVLSTSKPADAKSKPVVTKTPVPAEDTTEASGVKPSHTDHGAGTVSDTLTTAVGIPTTASPGDRDSAQSTGDKKTTITGNDSSHLNYLYPVMIVALGVGIPTLTACYYLCRKLSPEEIEEQRLIAERKQKLAEQQKVTKP